ncbi:MAG: hypothetical protein WCP20_10050 [Desulfuromonadales bacterium]
MSKPRLNEREKSIIVQRLAEGVSGYGIAKELGRDNRTIYDRAKRPEIQEQVEVMRQDLAEKYEELNHRMLDSITDADIQKINAYQRIISSGVLTDKARLIRGLSTNITLSVLLSRHVRDTEIDPENQGTIIEINDDI